MKKIYLLSFLLLLLNLSSCTDSEVSFIKSAEFDDCPNITVEEMINSYLSSPKWEAIVADDGRTYVNVRGGMTYDGDPADALIQFKIRDDLFQINAFELNGVPQNEFTIGILVSNMCDEAF